MSDKPDLGAIPISIIPVGSRVTCSPPPSGTDRDWLVLVPVESYDAFANQLIADGWQVGGSLIPYNNDTRESEAHFNSFVKGIENVITTTSEVFQRRFLAASSIARRHNLLEKFDRIQLFQAVLYGAISDPLFEPMAFVQQLEESF